MPPLVSTDNNLIRRLNEDAQTVATLSPVFFTKSGISNDLSTELVGGGKGFTKTFNYDTIYK